MEWTVKQISEQTGIPADTLRYYDKQGSRCGKPDLLCQRTGST
jgi:hypothetical protein